MNVEADSYILNDLDSYVISLHRFLCDSSLNQDLFFDNIFSVIEKYGLSCSYRYDIVPDDLKREFVKTYYAKFNKEAYTRLRADYNRDFRDNTLYLYLLLIYGFNRMIRFNRTGDFNLPVGNVDFNRNTYDALVDYFDIVGRKNISWHNKDFHQFFDDLSLRKDDFVYLDPPYLITFSEYNKYWNDEAEVDLLKILDDLDGKGIRFAISNVTHYKGKVNSAFLDWSSKYKSYPIKSNYISYHDNSIKTFNEVLIVNY